MKFKPTIEQQKVLDYKGKNLIVSASAGSGKTSTLIELIASLIEKGCSVKRIMLLTFTKASALEMKERLISKLLTMSSCQNAIDALDDVSTADISTIHAFLERIVKRNINYLPIEDGFSILSEEECRELKDQAFKNAEQEFKESNLISYENLFLKFHNDRSQIFEMLETMNSFFSSINDGEKMIEQHKISQKTYFDDALDFIVKYYEKPIKNVNLSLNYLRSKFEDDKFITYIEELGHLFDMDVSLESLKKISKSNISTCPTSKKCNQEALVLLKETYHIAKELQNEIKDLNLLDMRIYDRENFGKFENDVYSLYEIYVKNFSKLKEENNSLDFNDLEKLANILLKEGQIKEELNSQYDYIFVDEYQDTNKVQEKIIKSIAQESHFVAVGDPKQSIYGFRNATSEIIKEDIKNFSQEENSATEFLRLNFRSDPNILNFVNNVFKNIMTEESVGIDYEKTSMLKAGGEDFKNGISPSVRVDVFVPNDTEQEKEEKEVYDIFEDRDFQVSTKQTQAKLISLRITELMLKQIYDKKIDAFRNVTYNDIVVLTRGRGEIVDSIITELSKNNIPVVSEVKGNLKSNPEIIVLINFLKILMDFQDDISLISVMSSQLGGFSFDELSKLRAESTEKEFYKIVENSTEEKVVRFKKLIESCKFKVDVKGVYHMLNDLFLQTDYYAYLAQKENSENELFIVEKFLQIVKNFKNQFSLPEINEFFNKETIEYQGGGNSSNAVTISTIHSSKGLEYPIVFLVDMGRSMTQVNKKKYVLNEKFGLALNYFSREDDEILQTPTAFMLNKLQAKKNFIDEIMLLYVAMTRAKNHLYIVGKMTDKNLKEIAIDPLCSKNYLEMILSAYNPLLCFKGEHEGVESNKITEIEDLAIEEKPILRYEKINEKELIDYLKYEYPFKNSISTIYKNTVTALNQTEKDFDDKQVDNNFIEEGNAYHLALKEINFDKINEIKDVEKAIEENNILFKIKNYLNYEIIFKNIIKLKNILTNSKNIYKETQFTSLINLKEINNVDENVMIQGVVDLFALGEENILIDFKYTNIKNINNLKKKYEKQLILYKKAIENAYKIKIDKIFLLSLKSNELIKI